MQSEHLDWETFTCRGFTFTELLVATRSSHSINVRCSFLSRKETTIDPTNSTKWLFFHISDQYRSATGVARVSPTLISPILQKSCPWHSHPLLAPRCSQLARNCDLSHLIPPAALVSRNPPQCEIRQNAVLVFFVFGIRGL